MKNRMSLPIATMIAGGMLLMGCSNTADNQADTMERKVDNVQDDLNSAAEAENRNTYERERRNALDKLYSLRADIDRELVDVNERLATKDLNENRRTEHVGLKAELERQQTEVRSMITKVESSEQGTWVNVKEETRRGSQEVENWWERTKDNRGNRTGTDMDGARR